MKIFLTGATGFIGKNLLPALLKKHTVVALVRKSRMYSHARLKVIQGDLTNTRLLEQGMKGVNVVIHLAASLDQTDTDIETSNVTATASLVAAAKKAKVKQFIFFSTEKVIHSYCTDPYTISKRKAESIVKQFPNHLIIRPTLVYGQGDTKYLSTLASLIRKSPIVPIIGTGKQLLQPIYVQDLVAAVMQGIQYHLKGTYLLAGPHPISYNEIVTTLIKAINVRRIILHIPLRVMKPLIKLAGVFLKNPPLRTSHLEVLQHDKVYQMDAVTKKFKLTLTPFSQGCKSLIQP